MECYSDFKPEDPLHITSFNSTSIAEIASHFQGQFNLIGNNDNELGLWIKVNTGMNRLGIAIDELDQFQSLLKSPNVLMTHLACADNPEDELNIIQFKNFESI